MVDPVAQAPAEANLWEDGIKSLICEVSELPVYWRDQERPATFSADEGFVTLFVVDDTVVGVPEERLVFNDQVTENEQFEPSIVETHILTIQVGVETYDNQARQRGRFFCNRIRTRMRREASHLALKKISSSLIDIGPIISAAIPIDSRQSSLSTMPVRLHAGTCERDKPFGFIETIRLTPEITGEDGNIIPLPTVDIDLP